MMIDGRVLKIIRRRNGLTQERLAEISMVGPATIKRIEKTYGPHPSKGPIIKRLATALNVDPDLLTSDVMQTVVNIGASIAIHLTGRPIDIEGLRQNTDDLIANCIRLNAMMAKIKFPEDYDFDGDLPADVIAGPYQRIRQMVVVDLSETKPRKNPA